MEPLRDCGQGCEIETEEEEEDNIYGRVKVQLELMREDLSSQL